ncbi:vWA domain-containing protein [Chitiniphilus eburneus]|uniref:VWA domain-containing protein n=1 Tax=Chitiniphilus eburneus TaxID=2571148 RepID=A0A4U0PXM9_9NEIS|nr:VWA domain-containing protein [Chitiniphilus eburneus]TJZ73309.1 VWA domain-containing protein [Chitiniphilus eburneus]
MKTRLISLAVALALAACSSTEPGNSATRPAQVPERDEAVAASPAQPVVALEAPTTTADSMAKVQGNQQTEMSFLYRPATVPAPQPYPVAEDRERYAAIDEGAVKVVAEAPVSTFSIDVDTGAYANVRRMLNQGQLPPADAVRVEELINYFPYDYPDTANGRPFTVRTEIAPAPWGTGKHLLRIGIKAQEVQRQALPPANLVFLVDVSGSMDSRDKLPLLQASLKLLVKQLRTQDKVALVVYAGSSGVVLQPTSDHAAILAAIDQLRAGGSTAGESGIRLAYAVARQGYIEGGINRVLLATDGDFNVGVADVRALKQLVERERTGGVSLTTLGFGTGNYHEALMEQIADVGNGSYHYIDTLNEGHKVLVDEMTSTLATVAKDVKIQVEFNPAEVAEYRLIGYENRALRREDFANDKVDAGDVGAGHTVTALYELTFTGSAGRVQPLRYAKPATSGAPTGELAHLRLRYKAPAGGASQLLEIPLRKRDARASFAAASADFRFASAVAGFGQLLRGGRYVDELDYATVRRIAAGARGGDRFGYRAQFEQLVTLAETLTPRAPTAANE